MIPPVLRFCHPVPLLKLCHPERSEGPAFVLTGCPPERSEGPAFAFFNANWAELRSLPDRRAK